MTLQTRAAENFGSCNGGLSADPGARTPIARGKFFLVSNFGKVLDQETTIMDSIRGQAGTTECTVVRIMADLYSALRHFSTQFDHVKYATSLVCQRSQSNLEFIF